MLTVNVDIGTRGTVEAIIHTTATNEDQPTVGSAALTQLTSDTKSPEGDRRKKTMYRNKLRPNVHGLQETQN